ncbi:unnamed protein product [Urochloa humidicola]
MSVRSRMGRGDDGRLLLPPGFRFRPTDEELLTHYLAPKAAGDAGFLAAIIREVDLYGAEPWDLLPAGGAAAGGYFFCRRSVKYPSGLRTNRATRAGYWKSTGKDKVVLRHHAAGGGGGGDPIGLKKTLVFYRGRAPAGEKTNWVMHEYRLAQGHGHTHPVLAAGTQQNEWVICRVFMRKPPGETRQLEQEAEEAVVLHHPTLNDHLNPSLLEACNGGETPAAVAAASPDLVADSANCFPGELAIAPAADHDETAAGHQGAPQLNHEELLINDDYSVSSYYASAVTPASELHQATLLLDDLSTYSFDLLPQLLDYEGF